MTEKEMFLQTWEREFRTTLKVLKAFPANKLDFKPHERSTPARELAWSFPMEDRMAVLGAANGRIDFDDFPKPPATLAEILSAYEKEHRELAGKINNLSDADLNKLIPYQMEPGKGREIRVGDLLWFAVMDGVNHRGQFAVYLRMAGGKVPSIYGPSADEPEAGGFF